MLFQTSEVGLTIKERDFKPFWNTACQEQSDNLWLPTEIDSVDLDMKWSNILSSQLVEKSWFSTTLKAPLKKKWSKTSQVSYMSSAHDYTDLENTKPKLKTNIVKKTKIKPCLKCDKAVDSSLNRFLCTFHFNEDIHSIKCRAINTNKKECSYKSSKNGFCGHHTLVESKEDEKEYKHSRKIRINTTPEQLKVYKNVFGVARKMYNDGLTELKKKVVKLSDIRDVITKRSDKIEYCKAIPLKIRQGALEDLVKAKNNCYKKFKKTQQFQKCKYRKKHATSQSIYMNHDAIKKVDDHSFYFYKQGLTKFFKNPEEALLRVSEKLPVIPTHCRLILKHYKYLYISIPLEMPINEIKPTYESMVSLDPGERTFQTFYSPELAGSIGNNTRPRYLKIFTEGDKIRAKMDKLKTRLKRGITDDKRKLKKAIRLLRKKFLSVITKPTRITKELHDKTALFLCKNFKIIAIPEYSSKETSKKLPKVINRCNQALSHYTFRERLIHKVKQWRRIMHIVPECYTSITCTRCGYLNEPSQDAILTCSKCKLELNRDYRASRNIKLKTDDIFRNIKDLREN